MLISLFESVSGDFPACTARSANQGRTAISSLVQSCRETTRGFSSKHSWRPLDRGRQATASRKRIQDIPAPTIRHGSSLFCGLKSDRKCQDSRFPAREATSPKREVQGIISRIYRPSFLPSFLRFVFSLFSPRRLCLCVVVFLHCLLARCVVLSCPVRL